MDEKTIARFWKKVDKDGPVPPHCPELGPCWLWTAWANELGYGTFGLGKSKLKASRVSWELETGSAPGALCVCHRCDNPRCVRASHLFLGTKAENSADMARKGRAARHGKPKGEAHAQAKVTDGLVLEIRKLRDSGEKLALLAVRFGVSQSAISRIALRKTWRHLPG